MDYPKQVITELQNVASDLEENKQGYKIVYYEKTDKFVDKVAVYFLWKPNNDPAKDYAKRSIYFLAPEQSLMFIKNLVSSYFYFKEKRFGKTKVPISDIRTIWLEYFLKDIKEYQLKKWRLNKNV